MDELLPPEPPGEKRKKGFFESMFSKKKKPEPQQVEVQEGNLQQVATQMPSKLEQMKVAESAGC